MENLEKLTISQAARELGLTREAVRRRIVRGDLKAELIAGQMWVIARSEVEEWKRRGRIKPGPKRSHSE